MTAEQPTTDRASTRRGPSGGRSVPVARLRRPLPGPPRPGRDPRRALLATVVPAAALAGVLLGGGAGAQAGGAGGGSPSGGARPSTTPTVVPSPSPSVVPTGTPAPGPTASTATPSPVPSVDACPGHGEGEAYGDLVDVAVVEGATSVQVRLGLPDAWTGLDAVCAYPFGLSSWTWVAPQTGGAPVPVLVAHDQGVLTGSARELVLVAATGCPGTAVLRTGTGVDATPLPADDVRVVAVLSQDDGCGPAPASPAPTSATPPAPAPRSPAPTTVGRAGPTPAPEAPGGARTIAPAAVDPVADLPVAVDPAATGARSTGAVRAAPPATRRPPQAPRTVPAADAQVGVGAPTSAVEDAPASPAGTSAVPPTGGTASPAVTTPGALPPSGQAGAAPAPDGSPPPRWPTVLAGVLALGAAGTAVALARSGSGRHTA